MNVVFNKPFPSDIVFFCCGFFWSMFHTCFARAGKKGKERMELYLRSYIIEAGKGNEFLSVLLAENGEYFVVKRTNGTIVESVTIRVDKDEKRVLSAAITSDRRRIAATVECETNQDLQQELLITNLPLTVSEKEEGEELTQEEVQEAVKNAYAKHNANCVANGGGPMMCFTQTQDDEMRNARKRG